MKFLSTLFLAIFSVSLGLSQPYFVYRNHIPPRLPGLGIITGNRPGGGFYSEVQPGNTVLGALANVSSHRVADDFEICGGGAFIDSVAVYAYSVGSPAQPITSGNIQIRANSPTGIPLMTGTYSTAGLTAYYRIANGVPNDNSQIRIVSFDFPGGYLAPGTYWVTYDLRGGSGQPGPYATFLTKVGAQTTQSANAQQQLASTGVWSPILDGSNPQDLAFHVTGRQIVGKLFAMDFIGNRIVEVNQRLGSTSTHININSTSNSISSLAYRPDTQTLYASASDDNQLHTIPFDIATPGGTATTQNVGAMGTLSYGRINAIEWNQLDNKLYGITSSISPQQNNRVFTINTSTGAATLLPTLGPVSTRMEMYFRSTDLQLRAIDTQNSVLYTVNATNGSLFNPINMTPNPDVWGSTFADDSDTVYFCTTNEQLWTMDQTNGNTVPIGPMGVGSFTGLVYINEEASLPSSFAITNGTPFGGNIGSLSSSDNNKLFILCDENDPNGSMEMTFEFCSRTVRYLHFKLESSCSRPDVGEFFDLYNPSINGFVAAGFRTATMSDSTVTHRVLTSASNYYNEFQEVKAQLRWLPFTDLEAADGWTYSVDLARMYLSPTLAN